MFRKHSSKITIAETLTIILICVLSGFIMKKQKFLMMGTILNTTQLITWFWNGNIKMKGASIKFNMLLNIRYYCQSNNGISVIKLLMLLLLLLLKTCILNALGAIGLYCLTTNFTKPIKICKKKTVSPSLKKFLWIFVNKDAKAWNKGAF